MMLESPTINVGLVAELGIFAAVFVAGQARNVKGFKAKRYGRRRFAGKLFGLQSFLLLGALHAKGAFDLDLPAPMDSVLLPATLLLAGLSLALLATDR